jgi:hypothetical protein
VETLPHTWVDNSKSFKTSKIDRVPGLNRSHESNLYIPLRSALAKTVHHDW